MQANTEGFLYPKVDSDSCTACGLCTRTCPCLNQPELSERITPPQVYAAWHLSDEIRRLSSSGGAFTALAHEILSKGGVVAGAAFDSNMVCRHILVEDTDNLALLRGSKYVQSEITPDLFSRIQKLLTRGRLVLFTGTPCQVAALRNYLRQAYETLFCCDLVCHGVPSPAWLQKYLCESRKGASPVKKYFFRDKKKGWKQIGTRKIWSDGSSSYKSSYDDPFVASFIKDYCLRESCYECKYTKIIRAGDITLADFWKVAAKYPEYDKDDKGTSLLLINSKKGKAWLSRCSKSLFVGEGDLDHAISGNPMLVRPTAKPPERETFFLDLKELTVSEIRKKYHLHSIPFMRRVFGFIKRRLNLWRPA